MSLGKAAAMVAVWVCLGVPGHAERAVRIGLLGASGEIGQRIVEGARSAVDEANARGGVGGVPVLLEILPPSSPWKGFASQAAELAQAPGLIGLVGAFNGSEAHLAAQIATRRRLPLITFSTETNLTQAFDPWIFRAVPSDETQALRLLAWYSGRGSKAPVVAVIPEGREGQQRRLALERACAEFDIEVRSWVTGGDGQPPGMGETVLLWLDPEDAAGAVATLGGSVGSWSLLGPFWLGEQGIRLRLAEATRLMAIPRLTDWEEDSIFRQVARESVALLIRAAREVGVDPDRIRLFLSAEEKAPEDEANLLSFDRHGDWQGRLVVETLNRTSGRYLQPRQEMKERGPR